MYLNFHSKQTNIVPKLAESVAKRIDSSLGTKSNYNYYIAHMNNRTVVESLKWPQHFPAPTTLPWGEQIPLSFREIQHQQHSHWENFLFGEVSEGYSAPNFCNSEAAMAWQQ